MDRPWLTNVTLNDKGKSFPLTPEIQGCLLLQLLFIVLEVQTRAMKGRKEERSKSISIHKSHNLMQKILRNPLKTARPSKFSKITEYEINIQKTLVLPYMSNEQS